MAISRLTIRRLVGRRTRQMRVVTATATGSTTTLVDSKHLPDPGNTMLGQMGYVSVGTAANLGSVVRITANSPSTTSITFTPALTSATATGDEIEIWNHLDQGVHIEEVHDLINHAIASVASINPAPAIDTEQDFDRDSPTLTIPASWTWFEGADFLDQYDVWHPVPQRFLRIDAASRTIEVLDPIKGAADTYSVRLRGATDPAALTADTDTTLVDPEWLVYEVSWQALLNAAYTGMEGVALERRASSFKASADATRVKARRWPEGMGIRL